MVHAPYVLHSEDDDWVQPDTLVREVMADAARERLVGDVTGHLGNGLSEDVPVMAFADCSNVDTDLDKRGEVAVRDQQAPAEPTTGAGAVPSGDPG